MGRSQETFNKKDVRTRKEKKRKAKVEKREKKKSEGKKGSFDDMIAYVDEFGRITSTPPDPNKKVLIEADKIEFAPVRNRPQTAPDFLRKGVVVSFNDSKGYGFIRDLETNKSVFVHANNLEDKVKENNIVVFEIGKGAKGSVALKVRLLKE
ncbi:MAG TPA: cold shock domain-containing protein [Bacteroidales bacterium]|nr:cold shock domain-containing protein [Bacteroidales bacterium]